MTITRMTAGRLAFAIPGLAVGAFGIYRLSTQIPSEDRIAILEWLLGALILHDGIFSPILVGVGWLLSHLPGRGRRYVQGFLIAGGLVTVIAVPFIYRQRALPPNTTKQKAILNQNFGLNLTTLLAIILVASLLLYALRVMRERGAPHGRPTPEGREAHAEAGDGS